MLIRRKQEKITEHNYTVRVIGEDLTFGEDVDADFDFNDVVFDVALESNSTWIKLKAAGGTLPLITGVANPQDDQDYNDHEVHHLFGLTDTGGRHDQHECFCKEPERR